MKQIEEVKILISQFQMETHSNSILDFVVWFENRICYAEHLKKNKQRTPEQIAKDVVKDIMKPKEGKK